MKIKICGITNLEDAKKAVSLGVDALGFVFAASQRKVDPRTAKEIIDAVGKNILSVGVFVNEGLMNIRVFARDAGGTFSNMMMLYGEYMKERRQKGPNPRFYIETLLLYEKVQEFGKNNPEFNIPTP